MKSKVVTQAKLQYYRHNYCLVCMTGSLGCRWHRYKQSTRDSRKRDLLWFFTFILTFLFVIFYFYFWLIAKNDYNDLNWQMFAHIQQWIPWYRILLGLTCVAFGYFFLIMVLYLCHAYHGHQLYIHPIHIILILLTLLCCIGITVALSSQWSSQWQVLLLSLKITGPFLQIGSVVIMTLLSWLIAGQWFKISNTVMKLVVLVFYMCIMIGLYISPLYIDSPCVININELPPKPKLVAHRGSSGLAPENTMIAFQKAHENGAFVFESDVVISYDGVPYLMHDKTLRRTTNVMDVFPELADENVAMFNMSQIKRLNAGKWFLDTDPMWNVGSLSEEERELYNNQTVPTLTEMIKLAKELNKKVMFDLRLPPTDHPYYNTSVDITIQSIIDGGLNLSQLWWLENTSLPLIPQGVRLTAEWYQSVDKLKMKNITNVNVQYTEITEDQIREYKNANITTNVWMVNSKWFYSFYWCIGTESITTNHCELFNHMETPVWQLAPQTYLIIWVIVDVVSVILVTVFFIAQRVRLYGTSFSPESISLSTSRHKNAYKSRNMKEQLLRTEIGADQFDDIERNGLGVYNRPAAYSMASLPGESSYMPYTEQDATRPDAKYEVE